ncbi:MAG: hypothetical protein AB7N70_21240 [Dehalococcoidia bacterium]
MSAVDHVDYRSVESISRRSGWYLRCPVCRRWSRHLVILGGGVLLCSRCWPSTKKVPHE